MRVQFRKTQEPFDLTLYTVSLSEAQCMFDSIDFLNTSDEATEGILALSRVIDNESSSVTARSQIE